MLKIFQSNNTNVLIDKACRIIYEKSNNDPFKKTFFIVESNQLKKWIEYRIAKKIGITINIIFLKLDSFILKILNLMTKNKFYKYDYFSYYLIWEIMNISEKQNISYFIKKTDSKLKRFEFSLYMSKLFKKYSFYRLNWINDYKKIKLKNIFKTQKWQILLWKICCKNIKKKKKLFGITIIY